MSIRQPTLEEELRGLSWVARRALEGAGEGPYPSKRAGGSQEFLEYRAYNPGDDWRTIDWKAYARTDRLSVKRFESENAATVFLLLDRSPSMEYGGPPGGSARPTKRAYAQTLAAGLALVSSQGRDWVSAGVGKGVATEPARGSVGLNRVCEFLEQTPVAEDIDAPLHAARIEVAMKGRRGAGFIVWISDFYSDLSRIEEGIRALSATGIHLILIQVQDPYEAELSDSRGWEFEDLESPRKLISYPSRIRAEYLRILRNHQEQLSRAVISRGGEFFQTESDRPIGNFIREIVNGRS